MKPKILIVAAEASSALYAKRLLELWKSQGKEVEAFGVGTRAMEEMGFECLGRSEEMAVVGFQEVISHWGLISGVFHQLLDEADKRKPQVALLLDYPDFNLRLAAKLKKKGIPVVYYISPQVWAWRQGRVKKIKACVDRMLVVFPFEKDFYDQHKVSCSFVGHPLLDELSDSLFDRAELDKERSKYGIGPEEVLVALMPGSRNSEINHHLATQLAAAERLRLQHKDVKVALLVAPTLDKDQLQAKLGELKFPLILMQKDPMEMVKLADVVLAASGTATLLVGLLEKPMVIMYKMNALTAYLARKFVRNTPFFGMINLVLGREVCREFFQEQATAENLADALGELVASKSKRVQVSEDLKGAKTHLGEKGATSRVAHELEDFIA
ncbi:MAG: lipid-A-disaccharide synthase [Bdellovibrionaceae bacterium]|nr:lipid-A-disaccharide synthase [Bdellovibrionales bacterium]MCB9085893.1 lipid-A-disaccharide synthase [Pseudobdellovibrionaceae bacterium]